MSECPRCKVPFDFPRGARWVRCPGCQTRIRWDEAGPQRSAACAQHGGNPAVGICRRCGNFFCAFCRTRWEDRSYCAECVERLADEVLEPAARPGEEHRWAALLSLAFGAAGWLFTVAALVATVLLAASPPKPEESKAVGMTVAIIGLFALACLQLSSLAAIGVGQGMAAIRIRGDSMILATLGLIVSCLLLGVVLAILIAGLIQV